MPSSKKSFPEFQALLRSAIESSDCKTLKAFAEKAGLAEAHLNRMLNSAEISRPTEATLKKILSAAPDVSPSALFESCGYGKEECLIAVQSMRRSLNDEEHIQKVENDIKNAGQALVQPPHFYVDEREVARTMLDSVPELMSVRIVKTEPVATSKGETAFCCKGTWHLDKTIDTYWEATTLFALYGVPTPTDQIIITDIRMDGVTMHALGLIFPDSEQSLNEFEEMVDSMPAVTTLSEKKYNRSEESQRLVDFIFGQTLHPENYADMFTWDSGLGTYCENPPKNLKRYILDNKAYFIEEDEDTDIILALEEIPDDNFSEMDKLFSGYSMGWIDALICIINNKFEEKKIPGELMYSSPDAHIDLLKPVLYTSQDYYFCYGGLDTKRKEQIAGFLFEEFKQAGFEFFGDVHTYEKLDVLNSDIDEPLPKIDEYWSEQQKMKEKLDAISFDDDTI